MRGWHYQNVSIYRPELMNQLKILVRRLQGLIGFISDNVFLNSFLCLFLFGCLLTIVENLHTAEAQIQSYLILCTLQRLDQNRPVFFCVELLYVFS